MKAFATIETLSNTTTINGRAVRQAIVELSSFAGEWLGSFSVFGFTTQEIKDRAYGEASINLEHKGYSLEYLREAA